MSDSPSKKAIFIKSIDWSIDTDFFGAVGVNTVGSLVLVRSWELKFEWNCSKRMCRRNVDYLWNKFGHVTQPLKPHTASYQHISIHASYVLYTLQPGDWRKWLRRGVWCRVKSPAGVWFKKETPQQSNSSTIIDHELVFIMPGFKQPFHSLSIKFIPGFFILYALQTWPAFDSIQTLQSDPSSSQVANPKVGIDRIITVQIDLCTSHPKSTYQLWWVVRFCLFWESLSWSLISSTMTSLPPNYISVKNTHTQSSLLHSHLPVSVLGLDHCFRTMVFTQLQKLGNWDDLENGKC